MRLFEDRHDAGRRLAERLAHLRDADPIVVGLPRGGVPVAFEVARALDATLDVVVVRKLGVPFQPELAMGAIGEGDTVVLNDDVIRMCRISDDELRTTQLREGAEVTARARRFRGDRPPLAVRGRTVIVVDDGIATGATARAALQVLRARGATRLVLAVPVAPIETVEKMREVVDDVVALETPLGFWAIGEWYRDFSQVPDDEVSDLLARASAPHAAATSAGTGSPDVPVADDEVVVRADGRDLGGHLTVPPGACGIVLFAHGSGSSRHSPRNRAVAASLQRAGLATLLFDLLTDDEATDRSKVFDIPLLADRLLAATRWLAAQPVAVLPVGYFGASTGAGAALWAAADPTSDVAAVVSRGGRPDLAGPKLAAVRAPTLLIVGGHDRVVIELNREAQALLRCENRLEIVPGATHLFEEPGTLEQVATLAADWFTSHLRHGAVTAR